MKRLANLSSENLVGGDKDLVMPPPLPCPRIIILVQGPQSPHGNTCLSGATPTNQQNRSLLSHVSAFVDDRVLSHIRNEGKVEGCLHICRRPQRRRRRCRREWAEVTQEAAMSSQWGPLWGFFP